VDQGGAMRGNCFTGTEENLIAIPSEVNQQAAFGFYIAIAFVLTFRAYLTVCVID